MGKRMRTPLSSTESTSVFEDASTSECDKTLIISDATESSYDAETPRAVSESIFEIPENHSPKSILREPSKTAIENPKSILKSTPNEDDDDVSPEFEQKLDTILKKPLLSKAEELKLYDQSAQEIGRKQSETGREELIQHQKSKSKEQKDLEKALIEEVVERSISREPIKKKVKSKSRKKKRKKSVEPFSEPLSASNKQIDVNKPVSEEKPVVPVREENSVIVVSEKQPEEVRKTDIENISVSSEQPVTAEKLKTDEKPNDEKSEPVTDDKLEKSKSRVRVRRKKKSKSQAPESEVTKLVPIDINDTPKSILKNPETSKETEKEEKSKRREEKRREEKRREEKRREEKRREEEEKRREEKS